MSVTRVSCHAHGGSSIAADAIAVVQRLLFMVLLAVAWTATAGAQERNLALGADQTAASPAADRYLRYVPDIDQGGGFHLTKHLAVVFGDIKDGSGVALGPAASVTFANGGFAQIKGVYSVRKFELLQARYDSPAFWARRTVISSRLRWQVAPKLALFPLGPDPALQEVNYGERRTEASAQIVTRVTRTLHVTAGFGVERVATSGGRIDLSEDESATSVPPVPGLAVRPWFGHTLLSATFDSRPSGYSRTGTVIDATLHDYRAWHDDASSCERLEAGAEHFVSFGARSTFDLSARTWLSMTTGARAVPFFLMPTLGGGDYLEAYRLYRFRDRNAVWLKGEYRRAVH
ncbi:MAG TPA: hypothetical protein VEL79_12875, partial [Vicinamibacterales bacterium]|nr:hypothetical protein [Vicinamibacterales bacterium]